jgi:gliding motility-associated protein GldM
MAGGKETPRQKMIGMMYLVLTALLAMNISKEVLDAFALVDRGLHKTEATLSNKNAVNMAEFGSKMASNREKTKPFNDKAEEVNRKADELIQHIEVLKARTIAVSHGANPLNYAEEKYEEFMIDGKAVLADDLNAEGDKYISKPDDNQSNTTLLVGSKPEDPTTDPWSANELKTKLLAFKEYIVGVNLTESTGKKWVVPEALVNSVNEIFNYPDVKVEAGKTETWESINFYHNSLAAILPILTKYQLDVQNVKADVLSSMLSGIERKSYKFTNLLPLVVPESNYILRGDSFRANVLLAAYDGTNPPDIFMSGDRWNMTDSTRLTDVTNEMKITIGADGLGKLRIPTNGMPLGDASFKGLIRYNGPLGIEEYDVYLPPFKVAEPSLVVSPTKMNVFYRGLPNPVEISVPGVAQEDLQVTITGGHTLTKDGAGWIVKPGKGKECNIAVSAKMPDGSTQRIGEKEFRVKRIPDPVPVFAGKRPADSTVPRSDIAIAAGVRAEMENFDFEVTVKVESFNMVFVRDGQVIEKSSNSNRVTDEMTANMKKVGKGQKVYIEKITVKMPDGTVRQVGNITLKVV